MLRLYNIVLAPLRLAARAWAAIDGARGSRSEEWDERLARRTPRIAPGGLWIHGASVGEVRVVGALAGGLRRLRPSTPLAVSAYTPGGRARLPAPPDVDAAFYLPLDFSGLPSRVLSRLRPSLLALVETELWPNLLHEAALLDVPAAVVNGRISVRRMARYRRLSALYGPLLRELARVGAQSAEDAARFVELGVPERSVTVTGNVKYDLPAPAEDPSALGRRLGLAPSRPVFVAGSTGPSEETPVLDAFRRARARFPELVLVLAPRHTERAPTVADAVRKAGLDCRRASEAEGGGAPPVRDVLLVDRLGLLAGLYGLAAAAFVGGSLVPVGGHNVLEPAVAGAPVLFGPHTENFAEPSERLEAAGAAVRVRDAAELAAAVEALLADEGRRRAMVLRGREVVEANRGALERTLDLLLSALDRAAQHRVAGAR